ALLAGLHERDPDSVPEGPWDGLRAMDRQWWVTMKRKLTGMDERYPDPVVAPRPIEGDP
ncbi:MAG: hypothetical protein GTO48_13850, partial [Xanthomonadales bacterium]|nr:hypothetical protein [Xanthomonadales bacterium]NIO14340.1 hypothetical protein [Xanthomonadales bacterium]